MKKLLLLASLFAGGFTAMAQQKADDLIKVSTDQHDFGKIKQNSPVVTYFTVTNISDKPVVVESAWASCGCTTPEISKAPIAPHSSTQLKVGYNAASKGVFTKDVSLKLAGVDMPKVMKIKGEVLDAASFDAYAKTPEFKKAEKERLEMEAKQGKEMKKSAKKAKAAVTKK